MNPIVPQASHEGSRTGSVHGGAPTEVYPASPVRARRRGAAVDLDGALSALARVVELGGELVEASHPRAMDPARAVLERAARRRSLAPDVTVVALLGSTGSGKSSLFNALTGTRAARTAMTRPTTTVPLAAIPVESDDAGTAELLDWLEVSDRVRTDPGGDSARALGPTTVLVDLPDVDSDATDHRVTATRLAGLVDVLVWVLDPEKYADAVVHHDFLAPMAEHAGVTLVVLNQADRLSDHDRSALMADLSRLLSGEGLAGVPVCLVSARSGEGVDGLRERIAAVAHARAARTDRLAADVRTVAQHLWADLGLTAPSGRIEQAAGAPPQLVAAAAHAAGVEQVVRAVAGSARLRAAASVGWLPVRWLARMRPDPIRLLHLGSRGTRPAGEGPDGSVHAPAPTSLPAPSGATAGGLRRAVHSLAVDRTRGLPARAAAEVIAASDDRAEALGDRLDTAIASTELEQHSDPKWWSIANAVQRLTSIAALAGGLWLAALVLMRHYLLLDVDAPRWGVVPWPTVLLLAGLAIGALAGLTGRWLAGAGAARRAARVRTRLEASVAEAVTANVVEPLEAQVGRWSELRDLLDSLR